jgi:NADH:ubiquinone oxidoreductase subunit B-like Fe-S oxidoreductase
MADPPANQSIASEIAMDQMSYIKTTVGLCLLALMAAVMMVLHAESLWSWVFALACSLVAMAALLFSYSMDQSQNRES